jgi:hypothetical protein
MGLCCKQAPQDPAKIHPQEESDHIGMLSQGFISKLREKIEV